MNKELAKKVMKLIEATEIPLNDLTALSLSIEDKTEQVEFRKILSKALMAIGYDLVAHVCKQYPDLDPDNTESDVVSVKDHCDEKKDR